MNNCRHQHLTLITSYATKLRCKHCHLTISAEELGDSHCPECFEERGERLSDFEEVPADEKAPVRYRCEECGVVIESGPPDKA